MDRFTSVELNMLSKRKEGTGFHHPGGEDSYHTAEFYIKTIDFTAASSNLLC